MYKILNWLFGWDYIAWDYCTLSVDDSGIARVYINPDGDVWYWKYKRLGHHNIITSKDDVLWLTCSSDKYMGH